MQKLSKIAILSALAALAACNNEAQQDGDGGPTATPDPEAPISIIRPDVEAPVAPELPTVQLEPLVATIGFPEGESKLDEDAAAALSEILSSEQVQAGGPIVLRAHSDAGGNDAVNIRVSQRRGEQVRDWLVENGVSEDRITVIAFGEQNPIAPNALPDGEPNEAGRAANRRVEVEVGVLTAPPDPAETPE